MTLTPIEQKALSNLPADVQAVARKIIGQPQVRALNDFDLRGACLEIITIAFKDQGQMSVEGKVLSFQRDELVRELRRKEFQTLTIAEVRSAFENGVRGASGPFFGMCAKTYHQFLKWEKDNDARIGAVNAFNRMLDDVHPKSEVPIQVKINRSIEGVISAFEYYLKEGKLPFCGFAYYDVLNELIGQDYTSGGKTFKTLITDPVVRKEITSRSVSDFKRELKEKKSKAEFQKKQDLVKGIEMMLHDLAGNKTLENKTKELMLKSYFDKLIKDGTDIRTVVKMVA